ncbi:hypothetical protein GCM10023201_35280 [Actinomycetospora corticicola]|uniref:Uncharacterized protein n=1 Tax=Actinomycetospora corticicola TaxID=663602 RepID=A0A7Y9J847_9PSEU|nr:DUF2795 domain-containing protein [Actinomycetospora corticicola]NYD38918.1 hypothetical protein [Actinomycetospora corticicola]
MPSTPGHEPVVVPGLAMRECSPAALAERLVPILRELDFPARRWQILTAGDLYGCDTVTRELLGRVPEAEYASVHDVLGVLAAVLTGRPVPVTPPMRGPAPAGRAGRPGAMPVRATAPARAPHRALAARRPGMPRPV